MDATMRLPGLNPTQQITAAADRKTPVIWVRQLIVFRELKPGDEHIARRIVLRPGFNILWAKPSAAERDELFHSGLPGHTAGKTTFCRLLRYALGEPTFGTKVAQNSIRRKFGSGWVIAEVVVGDVLWLVGRPLGVGAHPFAVRDCSVEHLFDKQLHKGEFGDYLEGWPDHVGVFTAVVSPRPRLPIFGTALLAASSVGVSIPRTGRGRQATARSNGARADLR